MPASGPRPPVLLVARSIDGEARTTINATNARAGLAILPAVLTSGATARAEDLTDLALLTGAEIISSERGLPPAAVRPQHIGGARRALLRRGHLTVIGGHGDRAPLLHTAAALRTRAWDLERQPRPGRQRETIDRLRWRQARLRARTAVLITGADTEQEATRRCEEAGAALRVLRGALTDGVVPGGGLAYLACEPAVTAAMADCPDRDEAAGMDVVRGALAAPFLQLAANAGLPEPAAALHRARERGPDTGVDVATGELADLRELGIRDPAAVAAGALETAAGIAGLLLSAQVVSHG